MLTRKSLLISRQIKKEVDAHPYGTILRSFPFVGDVIAANTHWYRKRHQLLAK